MGLPASQGTHKPGGQHNDEGMINDLPAVTTMPGRFKAPPMFLGPLRKPPGSLCSYNKNAQSNWGNGTLDLNDPIQLNSL